MFTVYDIMKEYKRLDAQTGNNIAATIPVKISGRCVNRRGAYKYYLPVYSEKPTREEINISNFVLAENQDTFMNTIRHEYAHAMSVRKYGHMGIGHGAKWKDCCIIVGCEPKATCEATEAQKAVIEKRSQHGYIIKCDCGYQYEYQKKGKIVKGLLSGAKYICPKCGGTDLIVVEK